MKKLIAALLVSVLCVGSFAQTPLAELIDEDKNPKLVLSPSDLESIALTLQEIGRAHV